MVTGTLQLTNDVHAIANLKARYGMQVDDVVSNFTPEKLQQLGEVFTNDLVADFGSGRRLEGPAAFQRFIDDVRQQREWMWHTFHSPLIEVDGDRAVGHWTIYCLALNRGSSQVDAIVGRYHDEYIRTPQGWRQTRLTFRSELQYVNGDVSKR